MTSSWTIRQPPCRDRLIVFVVAHDKLFHGYDNANEQNKEDDVKLPRSNPQTRRGKGWLGWGTLKVALAARNRSLSYLICSSALSVPAVYFIKLQNCISVQKNCIPCVLKNFGEISTTIST